MPKEQLDQVRLKQIQYLENKGINPYPAERPPRTHKNIEVNKQYDQLEGQEVSIVGRMMSVRDHKNRFFFDVYDESGKIQVTFDLESIGEEMLSIFEKGYGIGDIVGVTGTVTKTRRGEVTVDAQDITMLAKALSEIPLGLKDQETLTRQRYLDMILNREVVERFKFRSNMVQMMRNDFLQRGYYEVKTPVLSNTYGGANARPFTTHHNALGKEVYLRISNELDLKKLGIGGIEGVFEFSDDFRNEGIDPTHNPEFTQVELYVAYTDYYFMMDLSEKLMSKIAQDMLGTTQIEYQGQTIDLSTPWRRLTVHDGVRLYAGVDPDQLTDEELIEVAKKRGITKTKDRGAIILELFKDAEPHLINPTFVIDYPQSTSPLTKRHRSKPGIAERFECYVACMEVMNSYTELNDPRVQEANFLEEEKRRIKEKDDEAMMTDHDFLMAQRYGMHPMGGIGISIDRWAMIYTNSPHIRDVITFPLLKPR